MNRAGKRKKPIFIGKRNKKIPNAIVVTSTYSTQNALQRDPEHLVFGSSQQKVDIFRNVRGENKPELVNTNSQGVGSFSLPDASSYATQRNSNSYYRKLFRQAGESSIPDYSLGKNTKTINDYLEEVKRNEYNTQSTSSGGGIQTREWYSSSFVGNVSQQGQNQNLSFRDYPRQNENMGGSASTKNSRKRSYHSKDDDQHRNLNFRNKQGERNERLSQGGNRNLASASSSKQNGGKQNLSQLRQGGRNYSEESLSRGSSAHHEKRQDGRNVKTNKRPGRNYSRPEERKKANENSIRQDADRGYEKYLKPRQESPSKNKKDAVSVRFEIGSIVKSVSVPTRLFDASNFLKTKLMGVFKNDPVLSKLGDCKDILILKHYDRMFDEFVDIESDLEVREGETVRVSLFGKKLFFDESRLDYGKHDVSEKPVLQNKSLRESTKSGNLSDPPKKESGNRGVFSENVQEKEDLVARSLAKAFREHIRSNAEIDSDVLAEKILKNVLENESLSLLSREAETPSQKMTSQQSERMKEASRKSFNSGRGFGQEERGSYLRSDSIDWERDTQSGKKHEAVYQLPSYLTPKKPRIDITELDRGSSEKPSHGNVHIGSSNYVQEIKKESTQVTLCPDLLVSKDRKHTAKPANVSGTMGSIGQTHAMSPLCGQGNERSSDFQKSIENPGSTPVVVRGAQHKPVSIPKRPFVGAQPKADPAPVVAKEAQPKADFAPVVAKGAQLQNQTARFSSKPHGVASINNRNNTDKSRHIQDTKKLPQRKEVTEVADQKEGARSYSSNEEQVFWKTMLNLDLKALFYNPEMNQNCEKHVRYAMELRDDPVIILSSKPQYKQIVFSSYSFHIGQTQYHHFKVFAPFLSNREFTCHWASLFSEQAKRYAAIHTLYAMGHLTTTQLPIKQTTTQSQKITPNNFQKTNTETNKLAPKKVVFVLNAIGERKYNELEQDLMRGMQVRDAVKKHNVSKKFTSWVRSRVKSYISL